MLVNKMIKSMASKNKPNKQELISSTQMKLLSKKMDMIMQHSFVNSLKPENEENNTNLNNGL